MKIFAPNRDKVIENIKREIERGNQNSKVEIDDPELTGEEKKEIIHNYIKNKKKISFKINDIIAKNYEKIATWNEFKETEIIGLENVDNLNTGAIITSNHFNPLDNVAIKKFVKKAGNKKLYIVSQETNLAMPGFLRLSYESFEFNTN